MKFNDSFEHVHYMLNNEMKTTNSPDFRVIDFNLITNQTNKAIELIEGNLKNMLKNHFLLSGSVVSSNEQNREFKLLFKKIKKYDNYFSYKIAFLDGHLNQNEINKLLKENNDKVLKTVISIPKYKENKDIKVHFLIFIKNERELVKYDSIVFEIKKKLTPDNVYYEDIVMKLFNFQKEMQTYKLDCIVNNDDSLLFIMNDDQQTETPFLETTIDSNISSINYN